MTEKIVKRITGIGLITTSEGKRINFNYSTMSEDGDLIDTNIHKSFVCLDEETIEHIKAIEKFIYETKLA